MSVEDDINELIREISTRIEFGSLYLNSMFISLNLAISKTLDKVETVCNDICNCYINNNINNNNPRKTENPPNNNTSNNSGDVILEMDILHDTPLLNNLGNGDIIVQISDNMEINDIIIFNNNQYKIIDHDDLDNIYDMDLTDDEYNNVCNILDKYFLDVSCYDDEVCYIATSIIIRDLDNKNSCYIIFKSNNIDDFYISNNLY